MSEKFMNNFKKSEMTAQNIEIHQYRSKQAIIYGDGFFKFTNFSFSSVVNAQCL